MNSKEIQKNNNKKWLQMKLKSCIEVETLVMIASDLMDFFFKKNLDSFSSSSFSCFLK